MTFHDRIIGRLFPGTIQRARSFGAHRQSKAFDDLANDLVIETSFGIGDLDQNLRYVRVSSDDQPRMIWTMGREAGTWLALQVAVAQFRRRRATLHHP